MKKNSYTWSEIFRSIMDVYMCGFDHIEDINHLRGAIGEELFVGLKIVEWLELLPL